MMTEQEYKEYIKHLEYRIVGLKSAVKGYKWALGIASERAVGSKKAVEYADRLMDKAYDVLGIGKLIKEEHKKIDEKWRWKMTDKEVEYRLVYKISTEDTIVQTGDAFYSTKAYAICQYYEKWRECLVTKRIFDLHLLKNGKEITKKVNKFLELYQL